MQHTHHVPSSGLSHAAAHQPMWMKYSSASPSLQPVAPSVPPLSFHFAKTEAVTNEMQLKHLSSESQRKDTLILDLRKQVSELLRFREQAANLRAQVALVEEREKIHESESHTKNSDLLDRVRSLETTESNLRGQIIHLEEEKLDLTRRYNHQLSDLHAQLAALRTDAERRETTRQKLEYELSISSKATVTQQHMMSERDRQLTSHNADLQERVALLMKEREEFSEKIMELQELTERLQARASEALTELNTQVDLNGSLRETMSELSASNEHMRANCIDWQSRFEEFESEKAHFIDLTQSLEKQLQDQVHQNQEATEYQTATARLSEELKIVRSQNERFSEEFHKKNQTLRDFSADLRKLIDQTRFSSSQSSTRSHSRAESRGEYYEDVEPEVMWSQVRENVSRLRSEIEDREKTMMALQQTLESLNHDVSGFQPFLQQIGKELLRPEIVALDSVSPQSPASFDANLNLSGQQSVIIQRISSILSANEAMKLKVDEHNAEIEQVRAHHKNDIHVLEQRIKESFETRKVAENSQSTMETKLQELASIVAHHNGDIETLFYAVGLLMRAMRPMRIRILELVAHKKFLSQRVRALDSVKSGLAVLASALSGQHEALENKPREHTSFRGAAIAVLAFHRLRRFARSRSRLVGHVASSLGPERFSLCPGDVIAHAKDVPSLVLNDDAASLQQLIAHFDPPSSFDQRLLTGRLFVGLFNGLRYFSPNPKQAAKLARAEDSLAVVRKSTLDIMKRMKAMEAVKNDTAISFTSVSKELSLSQAANQSLEQSLTQHAELCAVLEAKIKQIEEDVHIHHINSKESKSALLEHQQHSKELRNLCMQLQADLKVKDEEISTSKRILQHKTLEVNSLSGMEAQVQTLSDQLTVAGKRAKTQDEALKNLTKQCEDAKNKEQTLQELVAALTEAQQRTSNKNNLLFQSLEQSRTHIANLKKELQGFVERSYDDEPERAETFEKQRPTQAKSKPGPSPSTVHHNSFTMSPQNGADVIYSSPFGGYWVGKPKSAGPSSSIPSGKP